MLDIHISLSQQIEALKVYAAREGYGILEEIADSAQRRSAYQDQQAAGLMSLEELGSKLRNSDNTRRMAERELAALRDHRRRVQDLEQDRDGARSPG